MKKITQECKINDVLSLKFENNETWIYINEKKLEKYDDPFPSIELFTIHCTDLKKWYDNDYRTELLPKDLPGHYKKSIILLECLYNKKEPKALTIFKEEIKRRIVIYNEWAHKNSFYVLDVFTKEDYLDLLRFAIKKKNYEMVHFITGKRFLNRISKDDLEKALNITYNYITRYKGLEKKVVLVLFQEISLKNLKKKFKCTCGYERATEILHGEDAFRRLEYLKIEVPDKKRIYSCQEIQGLEYLYYLEWLEIVGIKCTRFLEIKNLQYLQNLKKLKLFDNDLEYLDGIQHLTSLEELKMSVQKLHNINQLTELNRLKWLDLSYNQISDIKALQNLSNLKYLNLTYNQIDDLDIQKNFPNIKHLFVIPQK